MKEEELVRLVGNASSVVKLVTGIGNNAAWLVALDGLDHARKCKRFKGKVRHLFNRVTQMFHDYEMRLLYADTNRMFRLQDMSPEVRKKYGNITDRQYYEMWTATGVEAYTRTRPLQTSLWNKYRLSLLKHNVKDAEHVAWVMTAMAALKLAERLYNEAIRDCERDMHLQHSLLVRIFGQFSFTPICKAWRNALMALAPDTDGYELDEIESRNIDNGLQQLTEEWLDTDLMFDSTMAAVEEYGEVFRTKGEQKKAMREIAKVKTETNSLM